MMALLLTALTLIPAEDPVHQGRPLTDWIKDLQADDEATLSRAIGALTAMGPAARPAVPALVELAFDDQPDRELVKSLVRPALRRIGLPPPGDVARSLSSAQDLDRRRLLRTLFLQAGECQPIVQTLIGEIRRTGAEPIAGQCRMLAAATLRRVGPGVLPEVIAAGGQASASTARNDFSTVVSLFGEEAVPDLLRHANDSNESTRTFALRSLGDLGLRGVSALPALREMESGPLATPARQARLAIERQQALVQATSLVAGNAGGAGRLMPTMTIASPPALLSIGSEMNALPDAPGTTATGTGGLLSRVPPTAWAVLVGVLAAAGLVWRRLYLPRGAS